MPTHPPKKPSRPTDQRGALSEREVRELAGRMYSEHHDLLVAIAGRHGPAEVDPEDTVQAAFAAFVQSFDFEPEVAVGWLVTTTRRLAWRAGRTIKRRREAPEPEPPRYRDDEQLVYRIAGEAPDPLDRVIERETAAERREAIRELAETSRLIVALVALGYSHPEIEEATGLTRRQIRKWVGRANRMLGDR